MHLHGYRAIGLITEALNQQNEIIISYENWSVSQRRYAQSAAQEEETLVVVVVTVLEMEESKQYC